MGFNVIEIDGEELRKYQNCVLQIAKDFVNVCEKYNLQYSLSGGSILGAIRHEGFIPWDDDIDINITRESYNRLLEIFDKELSDSYYIQTPQNTPELGIMVTQIRKKNTVARRKYDWNINPCGVSIDLYILENVYDSKVKRFFQKNFSMLCSFAVSSIRMCKNQNLPKEIAYAEGRKINMKFLKLFVGRVFGIIPLNTWMNMCDKVNSSCKDNNTKLVAIPTGRKHFSGEIYKREDMCVFRKAKFETELFNIPIKAEKYLEFFYGDYMKIPPKNQQEKHIFLELEF